MGRYRAVIEYRDLAEGDLCRALFRDFQRRQVVTDCWRRVDGCWTVRADPFIDDWSEEDYRFLVKCLRHTAASGGLVRGAFLDGALKGFVSVERAPLGSRGQYLDLSSIHVSQDVRRQGIGRTLFQAALDFARERGAEKLYISAHSAVESQAFYRSLDCVEAEEYDAEHTAREPFDCQLECRVPAGPRDHL